MFFQSLDQIILPKELRGRVLLKLHMGERGNKTHVSREETRIVFEKIVANGGEPVLFDSTTLYPLDRFTSSGYAEVAEENGFEGFPVLISRDDSLYFMGVKLCRELSDFDSFVVFSHFKGHGSTGFGGALKNLAMGCTTKEEKRFMHSFCRPVYDNKKCIGCGACVEACGFGFLEFSHTLSFNEINCPACGKCIQSCPSSALHKARNGEKKSFEAIAKAAFAVDCFFKKKGVFYINVVKRITEACDCVSESPLVAPDVGFFSGENPLKIDEESLESVKKVAPNSLDFNKCERFLKSARKFFERN